MLPPAHYLTELCVEKKFAHQNFLLRIGVENMIILDKSFLLHAWRFNFFVVCISKGVSFANNWDEIKFQNSLTHDALLLSFRFPRLALQRVLQRKITQRLRPHFSQQLDFQWVDSLWNKWQNHRANFKWTNMDGPRGWISSWVPTHQWLNDFSPLII